jgi:hypothetical protein
VRGAGFHPSHHDASPVVLQVVCKLAVAFVSVVAHHLRNILRSRIILVSSLFVWLGQKRCVGPSPVCAKRRAAVSAKHRLVVR